MAKENLQWALQAEQLGTGHAVMQAMPNVADDELVLVLYGDVPLIRAETLRQLIAAAGAEAMSLLTVMLEIPAATAASCATRAAPSRRSSSRRTPARRQLKIREGNSGIMAVPAKLLRKWLGKLKNANAQGEYYLTDVIAMAVKDKVKVTPLIAPTVAEVLGVNDKVQLAELEAMHRAERARELMVAGATLADPARIDIRGEVSVGRDVVPRRQCAARRQGHARRSRTHRAERGAARCSHRRGQRRSIRIRCSSRACSARGCIIGPYARVRPGSKLGANVHIGNFVELKKTEIADGSKANHLTYLGDAVIGKGVNVGAGTITCNYDGVNKSTTTIEDGAFIGSGNMLVAPVRIGKNATTGAGSTITKDAPDGQLTLSRGKQVTLEGWKRPEKKPK